MEEAGIRGPKNGKDPANPLKQKYYCIRLESGKREVKPLVISKPELPTISSTWRGVYLSRDSRLTSDFNGTMDWCQSTKGTLRLSEPWLSVLMLGVKQSGLLLATDRSHWYVICWGTLLKTPFGITAARAGIRARTRNKFQSSMCLCTRKTRAEETATPGAFWILRQHHTTPQGR